MTHRPRADHHLHLEHKPFALHTADGGARDGEAEGAGEVGDAWSEDYHRGEEVGTAGDELAFEVPNADADWGGTGQRGRRRAVPRPGDNVEVVCLLKAIAEVERQALYMRVSRG